MARRSRSLTPLVALLVLALVVAPVGRPIHARAAVTQPNIVFILTDDQTPDSIPHTPAVMPRLQGMLNDPADHWVQFSHAYFNVSLCCPSRATILSGQYDTHTGVSVNGNGPMFNESATIATWLHTAGYHTGYVGKYLNNWPFGRALYTPPGWDTFKVFITDEDRYYNYQLYNPDVPGSIEYHGTAPADYSTTVIGNKAVGFINAAPSDQPFFLTFAPRAPHPPSVPAPGDAGTYKYLPMPPPPSFNEADVSDKPDYIQALPLLGDRGIKKEKANRRKSYESLIEVDRQVADVVQALKDKGVYDNTVIVYMTDNGYSYGEHRYVSKGCEYIECQQTPLLVRYPGATPHVEPALASNVDIAPTFAAIGGATPTITEDGFSLKPFLDGTPPPSWRKGVLIHFIGDRRVTRYWGVYTLDYLYVELDSGTVNVELYDLTGQRGSADPDELENRANDAAYAGVRTQLASLLATLKATAT